MTLSQAIKSLVEAKGVSILTSPMALNILSDYNAFSEHPSSKNILKNVISEGYLEKIAFFYDNQLPLGDAPQTYLSEMYMKLGFRQDVAAYVLNSILEALGLEGILKVMTEPNANRNEAKNTDEVKETEESYQQDGTHLEFKGIPINGTSDVVATRLKQLGYTELDRDEDVVLLNGRYAGIDNCQIIVSGSPYTKMTYSVAIFTTPFLGWWSVKGEYSKMKSMLEKKYGKPYKCQEFFTPPYEEGDGYELSALSTGNGFYATSFKNDKGEISIIISGEGKLLIRYVDTVNEQMHNDLERLAAENDI